MPQVARCPDCLLSPEGWAKLWGALPSLLNELEVYEEMARRGDDSAETRAAVELLLRRAEAAKAASLCCCPDHVYAVASMCIQELLHNRALLYALSFDNAADTARARFRWLVECVRDGCHE